MEKNYDVIVDEQCQEHGGQNYAYQYHDENFERIELICEGCTSLTPHTVSEEVQTSRSTRDHSRPRSGR